jgi:hypothetical protein
MGMFDMTMKEEHVEPFRQQLLEAVRDHVNGEEVLAAGAFRRGGASGSYAASKAGGGLVYAAVALGRKKKAGGLPQQVLLAVTPARLYAFELKFKGRKYTAKREVAVWDRAGLRISSTPKMGLTQITIESPAEGEKATLVPIGVKDDPVNLGVIQLLEEAHPSPAG